MARSVERYVGSSSRHYSATEAAGRLHRAELVDDQRGRITVLDRPGLERRSYECYATTRLLGHRTNTMSV